MPFGLSNAPASFQGYINKILAENLDVFIIVYLDDILIYTEDQGQDHVNAVRWVLDLLRKNGLFANLKKCRFNKDKVRFLGYVVSAQGVKMEDKQIKAVKNWSEPKLEWDIQVFIGFANFYWCFIQGFSRIATPLTSMLKTTWSLGSAPTEDEVVGDGGGRADEMVENLSKSKKPKNDKSGNSTRIPTTGATGESTFLTPDAKKAFNRLRQAFIEAAILQHFDLKSHIRMETNASGYAIGGVYSQLSSDWIALDGLNLTKFNFGQWHPVAYFSRKMIPAETQYKTHDAKLLAIVEAFKTWRHYLEGCKHEVLVLTDHNNLCRFMDTKSLSSRQVRWTQELSKYHFRIDYQQGKANGAASALSRFPPRNLDEEEKLWAENTQILYRLQSFLTKASLSGVSIGSKANLSTLYRVFICETHVLPRLHQFWDTFRTELANKNPYKASIGGMRLRLLELQESDKESGKIRVEGLDGYEEIDGVLYYQGLPFVPEIIQTELISWHHDNPLASHFGINKTKNLISGTYYWPSLRKDVEAYVKGCNVCLGLKAVRHKPYSDLQSLPVPTHQWKDLSIDFVTGLPISTNWKGESYDSILVIVDRLTKMVHYEPVKVTINTPGLAEVIFDVVVWYHGLPDSIVTDRGLLFISKLWLSLCYFLSIKRRLSTTFYPQTDDQTERQNSTMETYLRAFVNFKQNNWTRLLPMIEFAYNNAKNASTGHISFELNCGYHPRMSYKEDVNPRSKSKSADELSAEL